MSLSDIFTPSVVISLAISLLLIGLLGLYVNNKMNEQNHKLNTMFDLVSTLANELQMVRSQVPHGMGSVSMGGVGGVGGGGRVYEKQEVANTNHLVSMIDVSDDSESSGDESDGETDEGAESDSEGKDDGEEESDGESDGDGDGDGDDEESDGESDDDDGEHDARSDKAIIVSESLDDALFEEIANLDDIVLGDTNVERVKTPEATPANSSSVKNLNVVFDYKKASLGKLREIVEQKGLSSDTSKLKKQELLKMLEID